MAEATVQTGSAAGGGPRLVPVDERVLSDVRHEIGNYLHKLYFWAEQVRSDAEEAGREAVPADMLDRSLRSFQDFLGLALEYFRPLDLDPVTVSGGELAGAVASAFRSAGERARVDEIEVRDDVARARVSVDPPRLGEALRIVARELGAASGAAIRARLAIAADGLGLELAVRSAGGGRPAAPGVVAWAVARRLLEAHGGSAEPLTDAGVLAGGLLRLPLAAAPENEDPCRRDS